MVWIVLPIRASNLRYPDFYDFFRFGVQKYLLEPGISMVWIALTVRALNLGSPDFFSCFRYVLRFRMNVLNAVSYISPSDFVQVSLDPISHSPRAELQIFNELKHIVTSFYDFLSSFLFSLFIYRFQFWVHEFRIFFFKKTFFFL